MLIPIPLRDKKFALINTDYISEIYMEGPTHSTLFVNRDEMDSGLSMPFPLMTIENYIAEAITTHASHAWVKNFPDLPWPTNKAQSTIFEQ